MNFNKSISTNSVKNNYLKLHHFEPLSQANGPGRRAVIWVQGCELSCPGCFNEGTHNPDGGFSCSVIEVYEWINNISKDIEGITVSGGEPLEQWIPMIQLLKLLRKTTLSIILLTGYSWVELKVHPAAAIIELCDLIIAGRYEHHKRVASTLLGSYNKTFHFITERYSLKDFADLPEAEVLIKPDGLVSYTGINPLKLQISGAEFRPKGC